MCACRSGQGTGRLVGLRQLAATSSAVSSRGIRLTFAARQRIVAPVNREPMGNGLVMRIDFEGLSASTSQRPGDLGCPCPNASARADSPGSRLGRTETCAAGSALSPSHVSHCARPTPTQHNVAHDKQTGGRNALPGYRSQSIGRQFDRPPLAVRLINRLEERHDAAAVFAGHERRPILDDRPQEVLDLERVVMIPASIS